MKHSLPLPDQSYLLSLFIYDPETGDLVWRRNKKTAGRLLRCSGRQISIGRHSYMLARVVWKMMTGTDPVEVDHRDRNPLNNQWSNLRNVDRSQNCWNTRGNGSSGLKGVKRRGDRYRAGLVHNKIRIDLGTFDTAEAAHAAYTAKALELRGEYHHG